MRLDHLLSKEKLYLKNCLFIFECTFKKYIQKIKHGDVAQLARAPALQAGGQEFDSPHLHQHIEKYIDKDEGKLAYLKKYVTIKPKS